MTVEEFNKLVKKGDKKIVKIGASWCGPCKVLDKEIDELIKEHPEVKEKILKVDVDDFPELAEELGIMSVPTCAFVGNGTFELKKGLLARAGIFEWIK